MATNNNLGKALKQARVVTMELTLTELSEQTGVSASHLGRVERGECFPSGRVLRKLANPLGFEEAELFITAGYLSPQSDLPPQPEKKNGPLDPYVAAVLSQEPVRIQLTVLSILKILKILAESIL